MPSLPQPAIHPAKVTVPDVKLSVSVTTAPPTTVGIIAILIGL